MSAASHRGDQHNPLFFDYFAEKNIIVNFARIIAQRAADVKVKTQVIQTLSILIQNTDSEQAVFYLLSNNYINDLIVTPFDFSSEDLLAQYISFLKTLSFKLNTRTILFFFNDKANDFPLYVEALKFFNHSENMVRIAVRTLSLNIYKVEDERMRRFLIDRTCLPYFSNLVWFLKEQTLGMSRMIELLAAGAPGTSVGKLDETVENMIDFMFYLQDILSLSIDKMSSILTDQLLAHYVMPVLIGSLVARYDPQKIDKLKSDAKPGTGTGTAAATPAAAAASSSSSSSAPPTGKPQLGLLSSPPQRDYTIQARLALYLLGQVFLTFSHYGLVNSIVTALLHPNPPVICETIVRTPIKFPFRHPRLPLTGIIFPKSLLVTPVVQVVEAEAAPPAAQAAEAAGGAAEAVNGLRDSDERDTAGRAAELLMSPKQDEEEAMADPASQSAGAKADSANDSALDFFSSPVTSRNSSPAPGVPQLGSGASPSPSPAPQVNAVNGEHAALMDMFSGVMTTPASPAGKPPMPAAKPSAAPTTPAPASAAAAATASSSSSSSSASSSSSSSSSSTAAASSSSSSSSSTSASSTPTASTRAASGSTSGLSIPSLSMPSLPSSSSATSLSTLRKSLTKSANAASEKLTNMITSSKALGVGQLDGPLGVFVTADSQLFVLDSGNHRIAVFDRSGKMLRKFGSKGQDDGQLMECEGISVHPSSAQVFVTDHNNHRVSVFDSKGQFLRSFGSEGAALHQFQHPTGLAFSSGTGLLYVCDSWNHRIVIYDSELRVLRCIGGKKGDGDGELCEPAHIAVCQSPLDSTQDRVYVTDYGNDRVQVFDQDGKWLMKFGKTGRERGDFIAPIGLAIHSEQLFIVDRGNHRVQVFDLQGGFVRQVGKRGNGGGELNEPNGIAVGSDGRLYVADSSNNRIMVLIPQSSITTHATFTYNPNAAAAAAAADSLTSPHATPTNAAHAAAHSAAQPPFDSSSSASAGHGGLIAPVAAASSSSAGSSMAPALVPSPGPPSPVPTLSSSRSTDELKHELPPDQNNKQRASLPEMKVVYNPEKSCPSYAQPAQQNRNKQAMMFALGSQDERVGFGAMGVLYALCCNEVVDKELLLLCGVCPQQLRKREKLLMQLTREQMKEQAMDQLLFDGTGKPDADGAAAAASAFSASAASVAASHIKNNSADILDTSRWADEVKERKEPEVDLMAFASASATSSPATNKKPSAKAEREDEEESEEDSDDSASDSDDEDKPDAESSSLDSSGAQPELERPNTSTATLDFFAGTSSSSSSSSQNGLPASSSFTKTAPSPSNASRQSTASSTFDILASFPTTPRSQVKAVTVEGTNGLVGNGDAIRKPAVERGSSNDPLAHIKPVIATIHSAPQPVMIAGHSDAAASSSSSSPSAAEDAPAFDYNHDIVSKLFPIPKPRQPPVRLTTLQLLSTLLKELTYNPSSPHPSLAPAHVQLLRDANNAYADELKLRFKSPALGNFVLDIVEEEWHSLQQTVYPKVLAVNTRNLLPIEDKQTPAIVLDWRRGGNDFEKTRKALQGYLLCRQLRYTLMKKKDPFYPLPQPEASHKTGDDIALDDAAAQPVTIAHHSKPAILLVDSDALLLLTKLDAPVAGAAVGGGGGEAAKGKVDCIISLKSQEPFAVKGKPDHLHVIFRSGLRPHPAARRVKAGPGVTADPAVVGGPVAAGATLGSLSGQKPMFVLSLAFHSAESCIAVRKSLEQGRIRLRKAIMNRMYKGFEQRCEEESTSIAQVKKTGDAAAAQPPIVPFSILNLLGDRQADIEEDEQ